MGEGDSMRIYIGGVGPTVTAAEIEKTFSSLGIVSGVELVRTNGRNIAYMNFQPTSDKSLAKLFSTYNGCAWKGGKLRLERAKEHYLDRLKREWVEDAKLIAEKPSDPKIEKVAVSSKLERLELENMQLRIYFPKLRKVKSLPFKGTGKHKYSFQRIEVPPLPLHFCDCEEHCKPSEEASLKYLSSVNNGIHYDKELSIMNSVMNKLLEKDSNEHAVSKDELLAAAEKVSDLSVDDTQDEESEETLEMDGDNLVTNIGIGRKDDALMKLVEETLAINQVSKVNNHQSSKTELNQGKANAKGRQNSGPADSSEVTVNAGENLELPDDITENEFSAILPRNASSGFNSQEPQVFVEPPSNKNQSELGTINQSWLQKSSWRNLVGGMENKSFSITNVLPGSSSLSQDQSKSDDSAIGTLPEQKKTKAQPSRKNSKSLPVMHHDSLPEKEPSNDDVLAETCAEPQPNKDQTEPSTVDTQSAKGQSWLQKSSWKDLVGGIGNSTFSITNVLPEIISLPPTQPKSGDSFIDTLSEEKKTKEQPDGKSSETCPIVQDEHKGPQKVCEKPKRAIQDVGISDVCTFMRSAESQKEWSKARAALSRHLNKKRKNNEEEDSPKSMKGARRSRAWKSSN